MTIDDNYARPDMLVTTDWVAQHSRELNLRIIDMRQHEEYVQAHIPSAVHPGPGDRSHFLKDSLNPVHVIPPESFQELMSGFGVDDGTTVVAYDGDGGHTAARLWWVMDYYGNARCKILNGGWNKWTAENREVTVSVPTFTRASYTANREDGMCRLENMLSHVGDERVMLIDVRSEDEWAGRENRGNQRSGHIPGAIHLEWKNFITADELKMMKPANQLHELLETNGINPGKLAVTY